MSKYKLRDGEKRSLPVFGETGEEFIFEPGKVIESDCNFLSWVESGIIEKVTDKSGLKKALKAKKAKKEIEKKTEKKAEKKLEKKPEKKSKTKKNNLEKKVASLGGKNG